MKSDRLKWTWFQPSSSRRGMVQMKGFTLVPDCDSHTRHTPAHRCAALAAREQQKPALCALGYGPSTGSTAASGHREVRRPTW